MENPWLLCGAGFLFCVAGVYMFFRNAFEENRKILKPVLLMIAGVVLIGLGMAKFYNVTI